MYEYKQLFCSKSDKNKNNQDKKVTVCKGTEKLLCETSCVSWNANIFLYYSYKSGSNSFAQRIN